MPNSEILRSFTPNALQLKREVLLSRIDIGYHWIVSRWLEYYSSILPEAEQLRIYDITQWSGDESKSTLECQRFYSTLQFIILDSLQMSEEISEERQKLVISSYIDELKSFITLAESEYVNN